MKHSCHLFAKVKLFKIMFDKYNSFSNESNIETSSKFTYSRHILCN